MDSNVQKIRSVLGYICRIYPNPEHLSKARITKLIYLSDWKSVILNGDQLTDIVWYFDHFGPYVNDVLNVANQDSSFSVTVSETFYGNKKEVISLISPFPEGLDEEKKSILDDVVKKTSELSWSDFIRLVYSTYPVVVSEQYQPLNLSSLRERYQAERRLYVKMSQP